MSGESGLGAIFAHDGAVGLGVVDPVIILSMKILPIFIKIM